MPLGAFAHGLHLGDVALELLLGAPQVAALGRRTLGDRAQAPRRLRSRPLGREAVRALRHAAAALASSATGTSVPPGT